MPAPENSSPPLRASDETTVQPSPPSEFRSGAFRGAEPADTSLTSPPVSDRLVPLDRIGASDLERVGGKAAGLGELIRAGLDVPPGFVITCDAFRDFVQAGGIEERLRPASASSLDAARIRESILAGTVSAGLRSEIEGALGELGPEPVAVRSSALAEDLPGMSFAGQHDTILEVSGTDDVLRAVRRCWASLFSEHAVAYRRMRGFGVMDAAMACVVQRMVKAEAAGVAFTADPLTGERDRIVINAVAGLGESLVSGRAIADEYVLGKAGGAILHRRGAGALAPSDEAAVLRALSSAAARIERHFKTPQDIEWAWATGRLFVLQSRPITSLRDEPVSMADATRPICAYLDRVREMFPSAGTPLLNDLALRTIGPMLVRNAIFNGLLPSAAAKGRLPCRVVGGRIYVELDSFAAFVPRLDALALLELAESGKMPPLRLLSLRLGLELLRHAPKALPNLLRGLLHLEVMERENVADIHRLVSPYETADMGGLDRTELIGLLSLAPTAEFERGIVETPPANGLARLFAPPFYSLLQWICQTWAGEPAESASALVSGLPGLVEVECAVALWDLAESARRTPAVIQAFEREPGTAAVRLAQAPSAAAWLADFRRFLDRFGHRAIEEVELARPRWREQPEYPLSVIASYIRCSAEASPRAVEQRRRSERRIIEGRIQRRLRFRPLRRVLFRHVLEVAQKASLAGENTKSAIMRIFWVMRSAALELGRRMVVSGCLTRAEDIFFLELAEIENADGQAWHTLVAERRAQYELWQRDDAPRVIDGQGRTVKEGLRPVRHTHSDRNVLTGTASSPGLARGRARIVLDPSKGVTLHEGEVLVAPYTDPAWTPLFIPAAAVVVEIGSLLSHASIVAREMGIPSVVAVAGAITELRDGDLIEVDGTRGTVRRLD